MIDFSEIGLEITHEKDDPFTISFCPSAKHININGTIHGGILFLVCDDAIGRYVTSLGRKGAAADSEIHFYRPALPDKKLNVSVTERKTGRRLGTLLVELREAESEKLIADAMFTVAFTDINQNLFT